MLPSAAGIIFQNPDPGRSKDLRGQYRKPVVFDECCYEGNVAHGWGNISARKMSRLFWQGLIYFLVKPPASVAWFIVLHFFLGSAGVYLLCRTIGASSITGRNWSVVTTPSAKVPPPVALTNEVLAGTVSVITTPVAFSLPVFE